MQKALDHGSIASVERGPVITRSPHGVLDANRGSTRPCSLARSASLDRQPADRVIVGVIGAHVSLIYALDVAWYYQERTASEIAKSVLAAVFAPGLLFGMGLLFFL
ncbi:MAG TPA: hypothetical protein VLA54_01640, partial [Acidimicrobiia bacterium]|nr:hypothetical protein [Acidimicrobiia bacterium]